MYLSVVVPCYNEEGNIPRLKSELLPALERLQIPFEILLIDDGSHDGTGRLLDALLPGSGNIRVLKHAANRGIGAALLTGFRAAKGTWTAVLDADLSFSPSDLERLLGAREESGADCVIGSPYMGRFMGVPWTRRLPSLILNGFYRLIFDPKLTAYTPIFRLYRTETVKALPLKASGFEINAEILVLLVRQKAKIVEIPTTLGARTWGTSKLRRFRELFRHIKLVIRLLS